MRRRLLAAMSALALIGAACSGAGDVADTITRPDDRIRPVQTQPDPTGQTNDRTENQAGESASESTAAGGRDASAQLSIESATDYEALPPARAGEAPRLVITEDYGVNPFEWVDTDALSTFAMDVDTGSYTLMRSWIGNGVLPDPGLIRVEEFVNFFDQAYPAPRTETFAVYADGAPAPFDWGTHLIRIGIKARDVSERPNAHLTFVIDVSGSMREDGRLELVKDSLVRLVEELGSGDRVAIVAYDDRADVILEPTPVRRGNSIINAIDRLAPGGRTNAQAGLELGYDLAEDMFDEDAINRVILASDGVANVGETDPDGILRRIEDQAALGINLVTVGVGFDNYNDVLLEQLADQGDGFYAYVDSYQEAERLFVEDLTGTLLTVARDAKVQIEFNEDVVEQYRLIGFENRDIADNDFRDNSVDAGEIGAGHEVTALYEVALIEPTRRINDELATVRLRWEDTETNRIDEYEGTLGANVLSTDYYEAADRFQLDVAAALYAEILRGSPWVEEVSLEWVSTEADRLARLMRGDADVAEFADLVWEAVDLAGGVRPDLLTRP